MSARPDPLVRHPVVQEPTMLYGQQALNYAAYAPQERLSPRATAPPIQQPPPPHMPSVGVNAWALNQKDTYHALDQELRSYPPNFDTVLAQQEDVTGQLLRAKERADKELQLQKNVLAQAEEKFAKAQHQLDKAEHSHIRKFFVGKSAEKKVEKREAAKSTALQRFEAAAGNAEASDAAYQPAAVELNRVRGLASRRAQIVAQQQAILKALFEGFAAGDDRENAAESQVQLFQSLAPQVEMALSDQTKALQYVTKAVECIEAMYETLRSAMFSNTVDLFTDGFVGALAGLQTNAMMRQASEYGKQSAEYIQRAVQYSPYMPISKRPQAGWGEFMNFANILFDNPFQDLIQAGIISKQMQKLRAPYQEAVNSMAWQQAFVDNIRRDRDSNRRNLDAARTQLINERVRLIHAIS
mmetsp:Transcript_46232/g.75433  ORF Transcript_46232/g.75433 Transcript_46232/m.75433 type:complete len:412 (+) Transcript_46232:173-1408(+)|eukprot:CAMPEP_0184665078 /NCGR_PEP_ID=MMETSP0308-20130426/55529_1 /TAXON_ID=38269 /ORGANISM="Gloeochaete witrockiana, Strain SAG 46.84" /LENGTH=411 /DNA_ID=CAMNT_0027108839 /DNA_START=139 /DNA_END=1374 /DNA_ORIENTATION=+